MEIPTFPPLTSSTWSWLGPGWCLSGLYRVRVCVLHMFFLRVFNPCEICPCACHVCTGFVYVCVCVRSVWDFSTCVSGLYRICLCVCQVCAGLVYMCVRSAQDLFMCVSGLHRICLCVCQVCTGFVYVCQVCTEFVYMCVRSVQDLFVCVSGLYRICLCVSGWYRILPCMSSLYCVRLRNTCKVLFPCVGSVQVFFELDTENRMFLIGVPYLKAQRLG